jgi:hypothetical protein
MIPEICPREIYSVFGPQLGPILAADAALSIYDIDAEGGRVCQYIRIQNTGTGAIVVALNTDASNNQHHVILQPGTALNDGKGGVFEHICREGVRKVSLKALANSNYCVLKRYLN